VPASPVPGGSEAHPGIDAVASVPRASAINQGKRDARNPGFGILKSDAI